jgi:hypothetical protein
MVWKSPYQTEKKIEPESLVTKVMNNVIDYDFEVATNSSPDKLAEYSNRFCWLVNVAESVCRGAGLVTVRNSFVDFENLSPEEKDFLDASRKLFVSRYSKDSGTMAASIERKARGLLEEIISGPYDAKRNKKEAELREKFTVNGKLDENKFDLDLARYRFQLLIEAAEAKKTVRKEMNQ